MAKILDKLIPSPQKKLVKLRQKRNWLIIERDTCKEELEAKVNKKLSALEEKFNKKLHLNQTKSMFAIYFLCIFGKI